MLTLLPVGSVVKAYEIPLNLMGMPLRITTIILRRITRPLEKTNEEGSELKNGYPRKHLECHFRYSCTHIDCCQ